METFRAGLVVNRPTTAGTIPDTVRAADAAGVRMFWSTVAGVMPDPLLYYASVAPSTTISFGTAIVPTYPRHPVALAMQALALDTLAPGRLRLGIGPSTPIVIETQLGLPFGRPFAHLREYLTVLRGLLWEGKVDFAGTHYQVHTALPAGVQPPRTPIPVAALREASFHLAGEISDGAISWLCPVHYLVERALPALRAGAAAAGRATPPLIAHVPVALHGDATAVRAAARNRFGFYARIPFYQAMFAAAGFPIGADRTLPDALLDDLVVAGDAATVQARLSAMRAAGVDELMVQVVPVADAAAEEAAVAAIVAGL